MFNYVLLQLAGGSLFTVSCFVSTSLVLSSLVENGAAAGNERAELPEAFGNVTE